MKKILFLLFFMPLLGISQAKFGGNSVAAARASLKNSNTYTLTYIDGIFYLVSTTTSYPIAFSTVGATGTGNLVYATSPTLVTPNLGTPSAAILTNATGLPVSTGISGLGSGIATFLATPSSANLAAALTDETGTGNAVFSGSPTLTGTLTTSVIANTAGANFATSSGNVGIGTTSPARKLEVNGSVYVNSEGNGFVVDAANLSRFGFIKYTTSNAAIAHGNTVPLVFGQTDNTSILSGTFTEQMRIDLGGNVGIGTTSPTYKLNLLVSPPANGDDGINVSNGVSRFLFTRTGSPFAYRGVPANSGMIYSESNIALLSDGGNISFHNSAGERMKIDASGNLGIGGNPTSKLHVYGNSAIESSSGAELRVYNTSDANRAGYFSVTGDGDFSNRFINIGSSSTAYGFRILNGATEFLRFTSGGFAGFGTTSPSGRLHVASTTSFVLFCPMTTAQRNALTGLVAGAEIYCSDCTATDASTGVKQVYNGSTWKNCW